jgi:galactose mutarotase-like enzyme
MIDEAWDTGRDGFATRSWMLEGLPQATAVVDTRRGARLSSLRVGSRELLVPPAAAGGTSEFRDGLFLMAPYAGRVAGARFAFGGNAYGLPVNAPPHSAHGVVAGRSWDSPAPGVFTTSLDERWPFGGWASIVIDTGATGLRLEARVGATTQAMPTNLGWHPWFRRRIDGVDAVLVWDADTGYRDEDGITSRSLQPRDPAQRTWTAPTDGADPVVRWPGMLDLRLSSAEARCWVVHETPDAICVEPQTAPGDALNAGDAVVVGPGESTGIDLELTLTPVRGGTDGRADRGRRVVSGTPPRPARADRSGLS